MRNSADAAGLFHGTAHSPSYFELSRQMGEQGRQLVDFCIPCNPYFPTPDMFDELARNLTMMLKFYPSSADTITAQLAKVLGLNPATIAMANGSTELITWMDHMWVHESLAIPIPTFGRWTDQPMETGKRVDMFPLREVDFFGLNVDEYVRFIRRRGSRVAVVCNPNNPDGGYLPRREIIRLMDELSDLDLVVIDESFIDFVEAEQSPSVAMEAAIRPNVVVLKSLGKNFGLHGIRFGYLVANPGLAGKMRKTLPKWNLNSLAETIIFMLDQHGAETLLGNGDMLFSDRGTKLRRIHGAFLSDDEVHRVVDFLKLQAKPVYDMDILKPREEEGEDGAPASDFHDDLYDQAVAIVCDTRQASVSYIQRRLQIGYNRAARMVEQMEHEGIVGPTNGAKPREVLAPTGEYLTAAGA